MRRAALIFAAFALLVLIGAGTAGWLYQRYHQPSEAPEKVVVIRPGSGLSAIAGQLSRDGLTADRYTFILGARLGGAANQLKAGEYEIPAGASMAAIVDLLRSGKVLLHRITVPEGLTSEQVVALVRAEPALAGPITNIPPEGSLLPETYYFERGTKRMALLKRMARAQAEAMDRLWPERAPDLPLSRQEAITLASIVEKETAVPAERPKVAGVFLNRLEKDMRLDSDPTVVYGLTGGKGPLGRPLTTQDLEDPNPFNTYRNPGLPPTPIANPGLASLRAALNPSKTDALYFVADGTGGHVFARSLAEHRENVARWRKLNRAARKPAAKSP